MKRPIKSTIMVFVQDIITGDKMGHHKHLSTIEREIILCGIAKGLSISKISKVLGRNKSTISRELKRNTCKESYSPSKAQKLYSNRRRICCPRKKLSNQVLYDLVKDKFLQQQWSQGQAQTQKRQWRKKGKDSDNQQYCRQTKRSQWTHKDWRLGSRYCIRQAWESLPRNPGWQEKPLSYL